MKKTCWLLGIAFITACGNENTGNIQEETPTRQEHHCAKLEIEGFRGAVKKIVLKRQFVELDNNEWVPLDERDYKTYTYYYNKQGEYDSIVSEIQYSWVKENTIQKNIYTYPTSNIRSGIIYVDGKLVTIDTLTWVDVHTSRTVSYRVQENNPKKVILKEVATITYENCVRTRHQVDTYNEMDGIAVKGSTETWSDEKLRYPIEDTLSRDAHNNVTKRLLQTKKDTSGVSETYTYEYY